MRLNIYAVHDSTVGNYMQPFFMHNKGSAIRAFSDNVNSQDDSLITKHPEQFCLFELGVYDDQSGLIVPHETPEALATGLEVKEPTQEDDLIKELRALKALIQTRSVDTLKEVS